MNVIREKDHLLGMIRQGQPMTFAQQVRLVLSLSTIIKEVKVEGGCSGNLQGISRLVVGMKATDAIERMKGISCGGKPTSCPDQLAKGLEEALKKAE